MRRFRKKFKRPKRPHDSKRVEKERKLMDEYGLKKKREIWAAENILRKFRRRARSLIATNDEKETRVLLDKLMKLNLLKQGQGLDDVLLLDVKDVLNRRLQTIVFKKGIAFTPKEARQFIVHGHVSIDNKRVRFPSYIVPLSEEDKIGLYGASPLKQRK